MNGLIASLCWLVLSSSVVREPGVVLPQDISGSVRGIHAVGRDVAAVADTAGLELSWRQSLHSSVPYSDSTDLRLVLPLGMLRPFAQWSNQDITQLQASLWSFGLAAKLNEKFFTGFSFRQYPAANTLAWDLGMLFVPERWLTLSIGVDDIQQNASFRLGAGLRPLWGKTWLTLSGDIRTTGLLFQGQSWLLQDSRLGLQIMPWPGLNLYTMWRYDHQDSSPGLHSLYAGLSLEWGMSEIQGSSASFLQYPHGPTGSLAVTFYSHPKPHGLQPDHGALRIQLQGDLQEEPHFFHKPKTAISRLVALDALAQQDQISKIILQIGSLHVGLATIEELRAIIYRLKAHGKTVIADLNTADEKSFLVAAAASQIRIDPTGLIELTGFSRSSFHLAKFLEKLGLRFDAVAVGRYKTMPQLFTSSSPSDEVRQTQEALLKQSTSLLEEALEKDRHLTAKEIEAVFYAGAFTASKALQAKLVDGYTEAVEGVAIDTNRLLSLDELSKMWLESHGRPPFSIYKGSRLWGTSPKIVVIPITGTMVMKEAGNRFWMPKGFDAEAIVYTLQKAQQASDVVGAVLRIDSPGGDIQAAETIWRAVREFAKVKPIGVSLGDVAASGGYYVATAGSWILAQRNTVTGSIGIFLLKPDISGTLEKLGIHAELYRQNDLASWRSMLEPLSDQAKKVLTQTLEHYYQIFLQRVADGRDMSLQQAAEIAEGRVYSGQRALELGLVDDFGHLADAIRRVKAQAGLAAKDEIIVDFFQKDWSLLPAKQPLLQALGQTALSQELLGTLQQASLPLQPLAKVQAWDPVYLQQQLQQLQQPTLRPAAFLPWPSNDSF